MTVRTLAVFAFAALAVACEPLTDPSCDICTTSAVVLGTVAAEGAAVAGAEIWFSIGDTECSNTYSSGEPDAVSAADGSFEFLIVTGLAPAERCVQLLVAPPLGSGLVAQQGTEFTVRFRADHLRNAARDTVEHHVALISPP